MSYFPNLSDRFKEFAEVINYFEENGFFLIEESYYSIVLKKGEDKSFSTHGEYLLFNCNYDDSIQFCMFIRKKDSTNCSCVSVDGVLERILLFSRDYHQSLFDILNCSSNLDYNVRIIPGRTNDGFEYSFIMTGINQKGKRINNVFVRKDDFRISIESENK